MEVDGIMKRNKLHAHNTMFHSAFWFHGWPEDLGLDDPKFLPHMVYDPRILSEVGFDNFDALREFVLQKLAKAAEKHDAACDKMSGMSARIVAECRRKRPKLVCQSWVQNEDFVDPVSQKSFAYDRRAPACCRPWHFKEGDPFTVLAFLDPMKTPPGPWTPDTIPETGNMHIHWVMSYDSLDNQSHYRASTHVQNPRRSIVYGDGMDGGVSYPVADLLQHMVQNGYGQLSNQVPPNDKNGWKFWYFLTMFQLTISPELTWKYYKVRITATLLSFALCSCWCIARCVAYCRRRIKRVQDHPAVKCAQQTPCCPDGATKVAEAAVKYAEVAQHGD